MSLPKPKLTYIFDDGEPSTEKLAYKMLIKKKAENLMYPNEIYELYGIVGRENIVFREKYVAGATQNLFQRKIYKKIFSERRDTPVAGFRPSSIISRATKRFWLTVRIIHSLIALKF
ncbi:MAG: hypothetical protein ACFFD2_12995 [Promethearchaeota archaeon]